jgi:hypothetical protein
MLQIYEVGNLSPEVRMHGLNVQAPAGTGTPVRRAQVKVFFRKIILTFMHRSLASHGQAQVA